MDCQRRSDAVRSSSTRGYTSPPMHVYMFLCTCDPTAVSSTTYHGSSALDIPHYTLRSSRDNISARASVHSSKISSALRIRSVSLALYIALPQESQWPDDAVDAQLDLTYNHVRCTIAVHPCTTCVREWLRCRWWRARHAARARTILCQIHRIDKHRAVFVVGYRWIIISFLYIGECMYIRIYI